MTELTPEQTQMLHAAGDKPMPVLDPVTKHVYLVIDPSKLGEAEKAIDALRQNEDIEAIREGIADMEAGRHRPIDEAFDRIESKFQEQIQE